jgi:hypothetical protein
MTQHFRTLFRRDLGPSSPAGIGVRLLRIVVHLSRNIAARSPVRKRWTMGSLAKEVSQCLKLNTYRPGVALSCTEGVDARGQGERAALFPHSALGAK